MQALRGQGGTVIDTHLGMMRVTALSARRSCGARLDSPQPATDCQRLPTPSELCWVRFNDSKAPLLRALAPKQAPAMLRRRIEHAAV